MKKNEILKAVIKGEDYDYIANNYWNMSKDELATLYKELTYAIYKFLPHSEYTNFLSSYASNLEEELPDDEE